MPRYPNSECEEHRNVQTSAPVCIVCMDEEITRLRTLSQASLDARDKEAKAAMSLENAQTNFHRFDAEERAHEKAMIEASEADRALREALATPNVLGEGPPERRSRGGNRQALLAGGPSRPAGWA